MLRRRDAGAGSFGIGLLASLHAVLTRSAGGPVYALHVSRIVIGCVAGLARRPRLPCPRWRTRACSTIRWRAGDSQWLRVLTIVAIYVNYFNHGK
jgi:hypothetical protein